MTKLFVLIIFCLSLPCFATPTALMKCLGQEELKLHQKKDKTYRYKLNQDIIGAMVQLHSNVILKPKHFKNICDKKVKSPAYELLKTILIFKTDAFVNLLNEKTMMYGVAQKSIKELYYQMIDVFLTYLAAIRANAPTKNCIEDNIPALKPLYERMLYLQEHLEKEQILDSITDLHEIFIKLEYTESIYKKCS